MNYRQFFKGKKITIMGLGLLGRGLGDAIFLAECGAKLIVTDLRDAKTLAPSLAKLKKYKNISYTLGEHKLEDFSAKGGQALPDFILKAAGVSLDSPYIAEARKQGIPIEMDASLFAKLMPKGVMIVGVTGTRGKSTTTALIYEILREGFKIYDLGFENKKRPRIFKGGNLVPEATLPLLEKVKDGDIVVLELDSWQLQGFHDAKISPQVSVFTTFLDDHLVYYKGDRKRYFEDKAAIFKYQKKGDVLVVGEQAAPRVRAARSPVAPIVMCAADVPKEWEIKLLGEHNRENVACAVAAARVLGIQSAVIKKAVESFRCVPGRLEYLRKVKGVKIYNDNNATTPDATIAALRAFSCHSRGCGNPELDLCLYGDERRIILIIGGTDKVLGKHDALVNEISKSCKAAILLKETGTDKIKPKLEDLKLNILQIKEADGLPSCVEEAIKIAEKGDIILFSPAFASFGKWFRNEYDRGDQFVEIVKNLRS